MLSNFTKIKKSKQTIALNLSIDIIYKFRLIRVLDPWLFSEKRIRPRRTKDLSSMFALIPRNWGRACTLDTFFSSKCVKLFLFAKRGGTLIRRRFKKELYTHVLKFCRESALKIKITKKKKKVYFKECTNYIFIK